MEKLSIVVPCLNEETTIPVFYKELKKALSSIPGINAEIIFIDDGSTDGSLAIMKDLSKKDVNIRYLSFSRNFGKEAAVFAGLELASGDCAAVMDVDLQDPPSLLPEMYRVMTQEGYDCVATRRITRKGEPVFRSFFAHLFYKLMSRFSEAEIIDGARDYRLMTRPVVNAILSMREYNRFLKGIYAWVGFKTKWIGYENIERSDGKTKWSFWKLFRYSLEGVIAFSTAPLTFAAGLGLALCILSFLALCFLFFRALFFGDPIAGWPSLVCIIVFLGGVQLLCLGVVGLYLSKTYLETKKRPIYIVREQK